MELIYEAFEEYNKRGFVNLELVINIINEIDNFDIYKFVKKEKENKELMEFWRNFNIIYSDNKNVIIINECCICYEEKIGISTRCKHFGCFECFDKICGYRLVANCPYCRRKLQFKNYVDILADMRMEENIIEEVRDVVVANDINERMRLGRNFRMIGVLERMRELMGEDDRYDDIFDSLEIRFRN